MKGLYGADLNGIPTLAETLAIYSKQRALHSAGNSGSPAVMSPEELQVTMDFYLAFSLFRSTAILQGVYKRYVCTVYVFIIFGVCVFMIMYICMCVCCVYEYGFVEACVMSCM